MRTLVVTNDFPPRVGGIQSYVHAYASQLPADEVVVLTSTSPGAAAFDAHQPFPVVRVDTTMLLPTGAVRRRALEVARAEGCDRVWFGAAVPLGLLARSLRDVAPRQVASTHGHEVWWASVPGTRQALTRTARDVDVVTVITDWTRRRLAPALRQTEVMQLPCGVDTEAFHPGRDGAAVRARHGLGTRPVVVCVSRLVPRKGQDVLLRALPELSRRVPGAALLLVGDGPDMPRLQRLAASLGVTDSVRFAGAVPSEELPDHHAAGDVFAMPCRTRKAGLEVEGLGIVFLEAAATGRPVVVGDSGGAPESVDAGVTGSVVDGRDVAGVTDSLAHWLGDPDAARAAGALGRERVVRDWRWEHLVGRLRQALRG